MNLQSKTTETKNNDTETKMNNATVGTQSKIIS